VIRGLRLGSAYPPVQAAADPRAARPFLRREQRDLAMRFVCVASATAQNLRRLTSRHQLTYGLMMMRTTLTLDDDVAAALERLRRSRRIGLKRLVNEALRRGLSDMGKRQGPREPVRTRAVALGRVRIATIDNIGEALAIIEGESFK
jgi:hypothetical protein